MRTAQRALEVPEDDEMDLEAGMALTYETIECSHARQSVGKIA